MGCTSPGYEHRSPLCVVVVHGHVLRAAPLVRVKGKITVKKAVCEESSAIPSGVFDWEFGFYFHEWSCSHAPSWRKVHADVRSYTEVFPHDDVVYLSSESDNVIQGM